jgi:hypothetical protein
MKRSIQQHPGYHEGFDDALAGEPLFDDASPEYRAGWEGAWQFREAVEQLFPNLRRSEDRAGGERIERANQRALRELGDACG